MAIIKRATAAAVVPALAALAFFASQKEESETVRIDRVHTLDISRLRLYGAENLRQIPHVLPNCSDDTTVKEDSPALDKKFCKDRFYIVK